MVQSNVSVPLLIMPPPWSLAVFPLTVQLVIVNVPELLIPPPYRAVFPLTVQLVIVSVPPLIMPPPEEVAKIIDHRSGLEAVGDLDKFLKFEMAKGLGSSGGAGQAGSAMGMAAGVGIMMPAMLS